MARSITAANAVFYLSIIGLYDAPQLLQGYAADAAFDTDAIEPSEIVMGVDGKMSAGFVPMVNNQNISLMPSSPSSSIFEDWISAEKQYLEKYFAMASIALPATGRKYQLTNGVLSSIPVIPGVHKVLQARTFRITWEDISPAPF